MQKLIEADVSARITALKALSKRRPTQAELDDIFAEMVAEKQDRSCVFLGAATVEWILREMVKSRMIVLSAALEESLFERDGPFSSFSRLIRTAHAFNYIDEELNRELHYIREIRNVFAHSNLAVNFETPEVRDVCELFRDHLPVTDTPTGWLSPARVKYIGSVIAACQTILHAVQVNAIAEALLKGPEKK